jgi:hypothetical protein
MHRKNVYFWLHLSGDLCIIIRRPPPRWAKWSRGVRTRGLRVGLVGGPRPLYFLGHLFARILRGLLAPGINNPTGGGIDFRKKWHNIRHGKSSVGSLDRMKQQGHR